MLSGLGGPDWNNGVEHSCTPTIDETGANHPSVILSRSLKSSTDDGPTSSESDGLDTAITVTECTTDETTDEGTEVVDGNNATLEKGVIDHWSTRFGIRMTEFHGGVVVVNRTVNTTHHTLIISKEEDGETSNAIDGDEKATLLISVDHIIPRNDVHGGDYPECLEVTIVALPNSERLGALLGFGDAESEKGGLKTDGEERLVTRMLRGWGWVLICQSRRI